MSGIVRKIDELGRIVIPKELRKTLNIKNNDDIEITILEDNKILLQKYYRLKSLEEILINYSSILFKYLSAEFLITDKEKILITSKKFKDTCDMKIGLPIMDMIDSRKQILENKVKNIRINNTLEINNFFYFCPIVINTDILGSIIILSDKVINEKDILVVDIVLHLLKAKLES